LLQGLRESEVLSRSECSRGQFRDGWKADPGTRLRVGSVERVLSCIKGVPGVKSWVTLDRVNKICPGGVCINIGYARDGVVEGCNRDERRAVSRPKAKVRASEESFKGIGELFFYLTMELGTLSCAFGKDEDMGVVSHEEEVAERNLRVALNASDNT
jgi:hypothetical protein